MSHWEKYYIIYYYVNWPTANINGNCPVKIEEKTDKTNKCG